MFRKTVSALMLSLLVISTLTLAFKIQIVKANGGTIYINADGSITPAGAPITTSDNITYTFTGNVNYPTYFGIVVERNNTVIDGNGYTVQGNNSGNLQQSIGLHLTDTFNVTIENANVEGFCEGIYLDHYFMGNHASSNNTVYRNNVTANTWGIDIESSSNNIISGNNETANTWGIDIESSSNNIISGNNETANYVGTYVTEGLNDTIEENSVTANSQCGIDIEETSNETVLNNNVTANGVGIYASSSSYVAGNWCPGMNMFVGNDVTANGNGICVLYSSNNTISENELTESTLNASNGVVSGEGIYLMETANNTVVGNNITTNADDGIWMESSPGNMIYHNNFIGNKNAQASVDSTSVGNIWDNGYPSGGNYWSDYNGTDSFRGAYQNQTGSDGIGDTPYVIDANNTDSYPLMNSWSPYDLAVTNVSPSKNVLAQGYAMNITIDAVNLGEYPETLNLTVYLNVTNLGSPNCNLANGNSVTFTILFESTGYPYGNYTVSVCAVPVQGETNLANNNRTSAFTVTIPGDVNGDFKVDMKDMALVARAFGSDGPNYLYSGSPTSANWNPNADINSDGTVNMRDIALAARHFGQHYP